MRRFILAIFFIFSFLSIQISFAQEIRKSKPTETESGNIALTVDGSSVHIQNVNSKSSLEIYNVLGVKINSVVIDSSDKTITLNLPKGCYILKIQDLVRKVAIK